MGRLGHAEQTHGAGWRACVAAAEVGDYEDTGDEDEDEDEDEDDGGDGEDLGKASGVRSRRADSGRVDREQAEPAEQLLIVLEPRAVGESSVILLAPPSTFSRCFNMNGEGVSSEWQDSRRRLLGPHGRREEYRRDQLAFRGLDARRDNKPDCTGRHLQPEAHARLFSLWRTLPVRILADVNMGTGGAGGCDVCKNPYRQRSLKKK